MFRAIFLRHGQKKSEASVSEYDVPLDNSEISVASAVCLELALRDASPTVWFTSHFAHCRQTAEAVRGPEARVLCVCGLTPFSAEQGCTLTAILDEAGHLRAPMNNLQCIGFVGHEERLSNFARTLVHEPHAISALRHLEGVCLSADTLLDLSRAKGRVEFRLPRPRIEVS